MDANLSVLTVGSQCLLLLLETACPHRFMDLSRYALHMLEMNFSKSYQQKNIYICTVNQQILAAIKFGVSQNKVIYVNLAAIKFGVSPRPVYVVYDRRICWRRQILAKTRNSPNIIARQNLLIYSMPLQNILEPQRDLNICNAEVNISAFTYCYTSASYVFLGFE